MSMLKVIDIVYFHYKEFNNPTEVLKKHRPSIGFSDFTQDSLKVQFIKHLEFEGFEKINGIEFNFFKSRNNFWHIPFKTHRFVKRQHPDVVIVEGIIFPLQLMHLKFSLGAKCKIFVQHHGEQPYSGIKSTLQKLADRCIHTYLFTSHGNSEVWINRKIIKYPGKCRELLEASTDFVRLNQKQSQAKLNINPLHNNFIWVGRLNKNKDPVTVLKGFRKYAEGNSRARLYMIFQNDDLIHEVRNIIELFEELKKAIILVGKVDHEQLPYWYSAVDYYISGSHREGSGYALLEAMACGCIPIVTAIPSFEKLTADGKIGFLYPAGDEFCLYRTLEKLSAIDTNSERIRVESYFKEHASFQTIANELTAILTSS